MVEVILKNKMTMVHFEKLLKLLYGTSDVIFKNGNLNDLRPSNVLIK